MSVEISVSVTAGAYATGEAWVGIVVNYLSPSAVTARIKWVRVADNMIIKISERLLALPAAAYSAGRYIYFTFEPVAKSGY